MTDLVEFIRQRLEDDERMARACGEGVTWSVMHRSDWRTGDSDTLHPDCAAGNCDCCGIDGDNADGSAGMRIYDEGGHDNADAEHIARHDPARVLREVEAKRALLAACAEYDDCPAGMSGSGLAYHVEELLALPYADHTDYREEWRP